MASGAALARLGGDSFNAARALGIGSLAELELGDVAEATRLATDALEEPGKATPWAHGPALACLAYVALGAGKPDAAAELIEHAVDALRGWGEKWALSLALFDLALVRIVQRRFGDARACCAEAIALCQEWGDRRGIAWSLGLLAGADAAEGHAPRAARLRGAMQRILDGVGAPARPAYDRWVGDRHFPAVREALGAAQYGQAMAEGAAMPLDQAIQLALETTVV
jgi:hypothetical protein